MSPSVGHHRVMEAARGALVTMVLKWIYDLDHTSESPAELNCSSSCRRFELEVLLLKREEEISKAPKILDGFVLRKFKRGQQCSPLRPAALTSHFISL